MKNGLYFEDGELIYYENDEPKHAGVIEWEGAIYYISSKGRAIKGQYVVHGEMTNGLLKRGTYTFADDYKLIKGSYIAPRKKSKYRIKRNRRAATRKPVRKRVIAMLKKKQNLVGIGCLLLFAVFLICISYGMNHDEKMPLEVGKSNEQRITIPTFYEDVLLCSAAAKMEYDGETPLVDAIKTGDPYRPFHFEYNIEGTSGLLYLGEREDLSDAREYTLTENSRYLSVDNLKVDTTYYYSVVINGQEYPGSFHTATANRFLSIPGLCNTRDIGGYVTLEGKTVKQGLLIRGVELDGLVMPSYFIPEDELENVKNTFRFAYDMDLRQPEIYSGLYSSRLGVPHDFYSAPQYGEIFNPSFHNSLRRIFADLADSNKYPMYLHCTWGQDRTGTIVFLLQGILNIAEEDMIREYRLTGYTNPVVATTTNMDVVINGLMPYAGETVQEKIVSFLISDVGVTESEIDSIRAIFLE